MSRTLLRLALIAALAVVEPSVALADIAPYLEPATAQKPRTRAGISLDADGVLLKADLSVQAPDHSTQLVPRVSSSVALTHRLGLETKVELPDWNTRTETLGAKVDTTVHFDPSAPFVDRLEGRFWRSPDGQTGQVFQLGFHKRLSATTRVAPLTIRSHASYETTTGLETSIGEAAAPDSRVDTRRLGFEAELTGILPNLPPARSTVRIKVEKVAGARPETTHSIGYTQNWAVRDFGRLGMNVKMRRDSIDTANELQPSIRLTWSADF
jgi:hypothetical protein